MTSNRLNLLFFRSTIFLSLNFWRMFRNKLRELKVRFLNSFFFSSCRVESFLFIVLKLLLMFVLASGVSIWNSRTRAEKISKKNVSVNQDRLLLRSHSSQLARKIWLRKRFIIHKIKRIYNLEAKDIRKLQF